MPTGKKAAEFVKAHSESVASVQFSKDGAQILSGGFDALARCDPYAITPSQRV